MNNDETMKCYENSSSTIIEKANCCSCRNDSIVNDDNCCVDEVGEMVQKLVRVFQLFERDQIKVYGFTSSQCYSLIEILKAESLTMNELSDKMNLDTSTMTRVIDKLVRDNLIKRERAEDDKRVVVVTLTEQGKEAALKLYSSVNEYYRRIISSIPDGKVEEVLSSVSVLLKAFGTANPNCC
jgi:DNA-binding MarR family transcriptional regulator